MDGAAVDVMRDGDEAVCLGVSGLQRRLEDMLAVGVVLLPIQRVNVVIGYVVSEVA